MSEFLEVIGERPVLYACVILLIIIFFIIIVVCTDETAKKVKSQKQGPAGATGAPGSGGGAMGITGATGINRGRGPTGDKGEPGPLGSMFSFDEFVVLDSSKATNLGGGTPSVSSSSPCPIDYSYKLINYTNSVNSTTQYIYPVWSEYLLNTTNPCPDSINALAMASGMSFAFSSANNNNDITIRSEPDPVTKQQMYFLDGYNLVNTVTLEPQTMLLCSYFPSIQAIDNQGNETNYTNVVSCYKTDLNDKNT